MSVFVNTESILTKSGWQWQQERTSGVQKDCDAVLAAGELGADLRCLMPRQGRMRFVGVDRADDDDDTVETSAGDVDLCIAEHRQRYRVQQHTDSNHRSLAVSI